MSSLSSVCSTKRGDNVVEWIKKLKDDMSKNENPHMMVVIVDERYN